MKNGAPCEPPGTVNGEGKLLNGCKLNGGVYVRTPAVGERDYSCGLGAFRPRWLQPFANKKSFLAVFCLTSVLQGMYYTYFVSVLTTIEKLYQIPSKTTGFIMAVTEVGQIGGSLVLTYYGGRGNRPVWISCGMVIFALASILCSTPHFLFGINTSSFPSSANRSNSFAMCQVPEPGLGNLSLHGHPISPYRVKCGSDEQMDENVLVLVIMFISLLLIGVGATAVYTLGIPYIDDNVATKESPLYFGGSILALTHSVPSLATLCYIGKYGIVTMPTATMLLSTTSLPRAACEAITIGVRIFGPVLGFLLGSLCTSVPINFPFESSPMSPEDPNWLGAWWLGVFIVGFCLIITSIFMMAFPRQLPRAPHRVCSKHYLPPSIKDVYRPSFRDFLSTMRRLFRNQILLLRTASSVLHILPIAGLYTFLPKYLESQYRLSATKANAIAGLAGILVMGIGIFGSGLYLRKRKPDARFVARWIAVTTFIYAAGMLVLMFIGCPLETFVGLNSGSEDQMVKSSCADTCNCNSGDFSPICTSEGVVFLSPCLAGCKGSTPIAKGQSYNSCSCMDPNVTAVSGFCPQQCDALVLFIIIFSSIVLVNSTSEVGSMLLTLRCVEPTDKSMALGLISFAIGLFGNVPCPVIYGSVVDSACLFWEDNCGQRGACRVYDPVKFRTTFHGLTALIMFVAFVIDVIVYRKSLSIDFHRGADEEDDPRPQLAYQPDPTTPEDSDPNGAMLPQPQYESNV
ncbi:hypothetical protein LAZ67_1005188 [Cordylochernes scorpioides]|uniref:Solute carrier organic anion transporter family member n=1 Tax=Cordylochernes scorpioides TaxID=51811 RepID=A0ABY6K1K9_9ARAC|nr:hypothetical protein LAZ67_1005188 [Cordylochernes scorpioides]